MNIKKTVLLNKNNIIKNSIEKILQVLIYYLVWFFKKKGTNGKKEGSDSELIETIFLTWGLQCFMFT